MNKYRDPYIPQEEFDWETGGRELSEEELVILRQMIGKKKFAKDFKVVDDDAA